MLNILQSPPYHCELQCAELVWAQVHYHTAIKIKHFNVPLSKGEFMNALVLGV
jgi:hypothetical protein